MRALRIAIFAFGCWGVIVAAAVAWRGGEIDQPNTYHPAEPAQAEATVDDVYAALSSQIGGATPDYETQVKPVLAMHLTYSELQTYVRTVHTPVTPAPTNVAVVTPAPPAPAPVAAGTISVTRWTLAPCASSVRGYTRGFFDCLGTVTLNIQRPIPSGTVWVVFGAAEFHGSAPVGFGIPGIVTVNVVASVELSCVTNVASYVDVRDGQFYNATKEVVRLPVSITQGCP